jgi:hypothetical protein
MDADSSTKSTLTLTILNNWRQWDKWLFQTKDAAKSCHVWQYIDPGLNSQPVEPQEPTAPTIPEPLTESAVPLFNIKRYVYEQELKKWSTFDKGMREMTKLINQTVIEEYRTYFDNPECYDCNDIQHASTESR